jgi:transcriptional accessory protein Tex/SPT6
MQLLYFLNCVFVSIAGFRNGCKVGITSHKGEVLATDVIYPTYGRGIKPDSDSAARKLRDLLSKYK